MDFADRVLMRKTHDNDRPLQNHIHNRSLEPLNEPAQGAFLSGWIIEGKFLETLTDERLLSTPPHLRFAVILNRHS